MSLPTGTACQAEGMESLLTDKKCVVSLRKDNAQVGTQTQAALTIPGFQLPHSIRNYAEKLRPVKSVIFQKL
jgi:hypothetical protein